MGALENMNTCAIIVYVILLYALLYALYKVMYVVHVTNKTNPPTIVDEQSSTVAEDGLSDEDFFGWTKDEEP